MGGVIAGRSLITTTRAAVTQKIENKENKNEGGDQSCAALTPLNGWNRAIPSVPRVAVEPRSA
jgi:hypothetical protein